MIGRLAAQMLDPYFVREEELAAIMERKVTEIPYRKYLRIPMGTMNTGNVAAQVPAGYQWLVFNVIGVDPGWGGVGALPATNWLEIADENNQTMMMIGAENMPATNALSYITWGLDLTDAIHDSGQLPPGYHISAPLPKMVLREYYRIRAHRDGIGGPPPQDVTYYLNCFEDKLVV